MQFQREMHGKLDVTNGKMAKYLHMYVNKMFLSLEWSLIGIF